MTQETPMGEALKTLNRKKKSPKTIRVCDDCGVPLIWTFAFDYQERYCLNCGAMGGMLGTGEDVPATKELLFQEKLVNAVWKIIYKTKKGLVPASAKKEGCKKCDDTTEKHYRHLTKAEKEWDTIARAYLESLNGFIKPINQ